MAINLLDMFNDAVGDQLVNQASGFLGESSSNTKSAIGAILPAVLGGLSNKARTESGAASILDFLKKDNVDGSILDNLGGLFGGGQATDGLMKTGGGMLDFIFGRNSSLLGTIMDVVTGNSGISRGSSNSLLKMVAPLLMGVVGRYVKNKALDAIGLGKLLGGQRSYLQKAAPQGLFNKLGFADLGDDIKEAASDTVDAVSDAGKATTNRLWPWLGLILAALVLFMLMRTCSGRDVDNAVDRTGEAIGNAADAAGEMAKDAGNAVADATKDAVEAAGDAMRKVVDGIASIQLPSGKEIKAEAGSFVDKVYTFLSGGAGDANTRFTFDNLTFQTGSANIAPSSMDQLETVAEIMSAYPGTRIRIEGHTDNTGDAAANKTLSEQRALAVKQALNGLGVSNDRIETVGYGQERPVASNDTEAGKRENRRVDLYFTQR